MASEEATIGSSAILRVAGLPIRFWLMAATSNVFALYRALDRTRERCQQIGAALADRIGRELVPVQRLSVEDRRLALQLRRRLHHGEPIDEAEGRRLINIVEHLESNLDGLARLLEQALQISAELTALERSLTREIDQEPTRLSQIACELAFSNSYLRNLFQKNNPQVFNSIAKRVSGGAAAGSKDLRRYSEYVWQLIDRAATRSTPRDWFSSVALAPVYQGTAGVFEITIAAEFAAEWVENIYLHQKNLAALPLSELGPTAQISLTPLNRGSEDQLQFWITDPGDIQRVNQLRLRRTPLLNAIYTQLRTGPLQLEELVEKVADETGETHALLRKFIEHLVGLRSLQSSTPAAARFEPWRRLQAFDTAIQTDDRLGAGFVSANDRRFEPASTADVDERDGYLDVYRKVGGSIPASTGLRLQADIQQTLRLLAMIAAENSPSVDQFLPQVTSEPRSLLDLLQERLEADEGLKNSPTRPTEWPAANENGSSYARLIERLSAGLDGTAPLDISRDLLDELGAPEIEIDWPIDCVLRLPRAGVGYEAVLDQIFLAGTMDARFVSALRTLHGTVPHADAYRRFLRQLEDQCDVRFVELLIPPLSSGAANAIRRPLYTRSWTGDADIRTYCELNGSPSEYIPCEAITIRRVGQRLVAEADGRKIYPMYHATRMPLPPWNFLAEILLSCSPLPLRWAQRPLHSLLGLFPGRVHAPRITVCNELVVTCAQWRVPQDLLWQPDDHPRAKIRSIERIRLELGLPRWLMVNDRSTGKHIPCDLESFRAFTVVERTRSNQREDLLVSEMLPAPEQLLVDSAGNAPEDARVSELILRMPYHLSPLALASQVVSLIA